MTTQAGGCLCHSIRYTVYSWPERVTICHCGFCQKTTGSANFVEPIYLKSNFKVISGQSKTYHHQSEGSRKTDYINFCETCSTKQFLSLERFSDKVGIYRGTFDNPYHFDLSTDNCKRIFLNVAQTGTIIPTGVRVFEKHALTNDGDPVESSIFDQRHIIERSRL